MNWKKGLFRAWAVASLMWGGMMVFLLGPSSLENYRSLQSEGCKLSVDKSNIEGARSYSYEEVAGLCEPDHLWAMAKWTLGPPFATLGLGVAVGWVISGFRAPTSRN
jgi:hypothetical protein